ncbi:hypothetical protein [Mesorhizobium sanjuanii]|nr:hypothetical protein [Mesorhizobium sanjuanii]
MVLALKDQWIPHSWYVPLLKAGRSIGDPELPRMNQETGATGHG